MKFYYIYVLHSKKDNNFYTGYTKNLRLRFEQHQKGLVSSTKYRLSLDMIYFEACLNQDALRREKYLKTHFGKQFLYKRLKEWIKEHKS